jgi:glycosyltransferase involved in cell wall biosynthesis
MARTSFGPNRVKTPVPDAPDFSLAVVTHYTSHAWHAHRMDVVRASIASMLAGTGGRSCELLIWDNESTVAFRDMLHRFYPAVLVESINIGAHNARRQLCHMARGKVICITDDDVLFSPNWLTKQLEVLTTYPNVGIVAGSPQRSAFSGGVEPSFAFANAPGVQSWRGKLIPAEWERDWAVSVGADPDTYTCPLDDLLLEYRGVKAWAHGHHMQMLCYRDVIEPFLVPNEYLLNLNKFNVHVGEAGLLQLTTHERTAVHIGNVIDPTIERIAREWGMRIERGA